MDPTCALISGAIPNCSCLEAARSVARFPIKAASAAVTGRYRHHLTTVSKAMFQCFACSSSHLLRYISSMKNTPCILLLSISRGSLLRHVYIKKCGGFAERLCSPGPVTRQLRLPKPKDQKKKNLLSLFLTTALPSQRRPRPTSKCRLSQELAPSLSPATDVRWMVIFLLYGGRTG